MRITWKLKNYSSQDFSVVSVFASKMTWKTQLGYLNLKELLSLAASKLSRETQKSLDYYNSSQVEWRAVRSLADDRSSALKREIKVLALLCGIGSII